MLNCSISTAEYQSLNELFTSTGGDYWTCLSDSSAWTFPSPLSAPCSIPWHGISCAYSANSTSLCNVISINLDKCNLVHSLSSSLVNISKLSTISLRSNSLTGYLPTSWTSLPQLSTVFLSGNLLSGALPDEWSSLVSLQNIDLSTNQITGYLPVSWSHLSNLVMFRSYSNDISGHLPVDWSKLSLLKQLIISTSSLSGSLPSSWSAMTSLVALAVGHNHLSHSLPTSWVSLVQMKAFLGNNNKLTGSLPTQWSAMNMYVFYVFENELHGSLPLSYASWTSMLQFSAHDNQITGTIPSQWSTIKSLQVFLVYDNHISGTIPTSWSAITSLQNLGIYSCALSGTLPSQWSSLHNVSVLGAYNTLLTGTLPSQWSTLSKMEFIAIASTFITGSLPGSWSTMKDIQLIKFQDNSIEGSLPSEWSAMSKLLMVYLYSNSLSGQVPYSWTALKELRQLFAYSNALSGSERFYPKVEYLRIDSNFFSGRLTIMGMTCLIYYNISNNFLSGNFDSISHSYPNITTMDLSMNQFTGKIPDLIPLFVPSIEQLAFSDNCFTGTISVGLCGLSHLQILILDNLANGRKCSLKAFSALSALMIGTLPACIFDIQNLTTLHAMGNGLVGSLPEVHPNSSLSVVSLMSNFMTGTIPTSWQTHRDWQQVLLSYNKFSGTLSSTFSVSSNSTQFMNLSSNRLSGTFPATFTKLSTCDVLEGNVFACPKNINVYGEDVSKERYSCGSKELQYVSEVFIAAIAFVIIALMYGFSFYNIFGIFSKVKVNSRLLVLCRHTFPILLILLIPRIIFNSEDMSSREYYYIYAWVTTQAYQHGLGPSIVLEFFILALIGFVVSDLTTRRFATVDVFYSIQLPSLSSATGARDDAGTSSSSKDGPIAVNPSIFTIGNPLQPQTEPNEITQDTNARPSTSVSEYSVKTDFTAKNKSQSFETSMPAVIFFLIVHCVVIAFFTIIYILVILQSANQSLQMLFSVFLAIFKVFWTTFYVGKMVDAQSEVSFTKTFNIGMISDLFTFLLCPLSVILTTDVKCFEYAIQSIPDVVTSYIASSPSCYAYSGTNKDGSSYMFFKCEPNKLDVINNLQVPWRYSFQCSSSLITSYVPVVCYSYVIYGILVPYARIRMLIEPRNQRSSTSKYSLAHFLLFLTYPSVDVEDPSAVQEEVASSAIKHTAGLHNRTIRHALMLLLFGAAAPLLGIFILFTILIEDFVTTAQLQVFVNDLHATKKYSREMIASILSSVYLSTRTNVYRRHFPWYALIALLFWSVFSFDMIADVYGSHHGAVSVAIFAVACVLVILLSSHNRLIEQYVIPYLFPWRYQAERNASQNDNWSENGSTMNDKKAAILELQSI